jgi:hypothetical protein
VLLPQGSVSAAGIEDTGEPVEAEMWKQPGEPRSRIRRESGVEGGPCGQVLRGRILLQSEMSFVFCVVQLSSPSWMSGQLTPASGRGS